MTTLLSHSRARQAAFDFSLVLLDDEPGVYETPDWLPVTRLGGKGGLLQSILLLRRFLRRERPDVTLSFLTRANICNALVMSGMGKPFVISERVHTSAHLGNSGSARLAKALVNLFYRRASRIIAVSGGVGEHLVERFGVRPDRMVVIHNPFDLDRIDRLKQEEPGWAPDTPFFLAMGRLVETKNFELLIRAYAASGIKQALVIVGEGPDRSKLEDLVRDLGLDGRVFLPGFVGNPFALMHRSQFYVLPSNAEGFPNGLVEAMAVGLPVLATDCPSGPAEILEGEAASGLSDGRYGLLTPCGNVEAMAQGLRRMADPVEQGRLAQLAKARAQDFSVRSAVDAYWNVISETLAREPASNRSYAMPATGAGETERI